MAKQLISKFDAGKEGWTIVRDNGQYRVSWVDEGGDPDGYLKFNNKIGSGFRGVVSSPSQLAGDRSTFFGGTLGFDLFSENQPDHITVFFRRQGGAIAYGVINLVGSYDSAGWNHYELKIVPENFSYVGGEDLHSVLSALFNVSIAPQIAGHPRGGHMGGLDNIFLAAPEKSESPQLLAGQDGAAEDGRSPFVLEPHQQHAALMPDHLHPMLA